MVPPKVKGWVKPQSKSFKGMLSVKNLQPACADITSMMLTSWPLFPFPRPPWERLEAHSYLSPCIPLNYFQSQKKWNRNLNVKLTHHYLNPWKTMLKQNVTYLHDFLSANLSPIHSPTRLRLTIQGALPVNLKTCILHSWLTSLETTATLFLWFQRVHDHVLLSLPFPPLHSWSLITERRGRRRTVWRGQCSHRDRKLHILCTWSWLSSGSNILKVCPRCCSRQERPAQEVSGRGCWDS